MLILGSAYDSKQSQINTFFTYPLDFLETEVPEEGVFEECLFHLGRKSPGPQC